MAFDDDRFKRPPEFESHGPDLFFLIPIGIFCLFFLGICCVIWYSVCKGSKLKKKELELQQQYQAQQERRLLEQERQREQDRQREREMHRSIMAQMSHNQQQSRQYYPPPPTMPPVEQMYPPPAPSGIRSQVVAPQLPPPLPLSAMPSPSFAAPTSYSTGPRTMPGWNAEAMQPKTQPGILITPKEDPTTKSVTINMAPAVVHPVSPPKRNVRPLPSLRERANQQLNRSSSSSRSGSYASERDSRSGSRRRH